MVQEAGWERYPLYRDIHAELRAIEEVMAQRQARWVPPELLRCAGEGCRAHHPLWRALMLLPRAGTCELCFLAALTPTPSTLYTHTPPLPNSTHPLAARSGGREACA